jgi:hypothetical protein
MSIPKRPKGSIVSKQGRKLPPEAEIVRALKRRQRAEAATKAKSRAEAPLKKAVPKKDPRMLTSTKPTRVSKAHKAAWQRFDLGPKN